MENKMIDWITGWIHLLIIDYDIIGVLGIISIYAVFFTGVMLWLNDIKKSDNYTTLYIIGVTFLFTKIVIDSFTINQVPFYIKHNGKYINIVKECAYRVKNNNSYRNCVFKETDSEKQKEKTLQENEESQDFESKKKQIFEKINNHP